MKNELFRAKDVDVVIGNVPFLHHLDFTLFTGESLGVLGTFDSGKWALLELLEGGVTPTEGTLLYQGKPIWPGKDAWPVVETIDKHPMLLKSLSIWENLMTLTADKKLLQPMLRRKQLRYTQILFEEYGVDLDPLAKVEDLTVFQRLLVEILKARLKKAQIILIECFAWEAGPEDYQRLEHLIKRLKEEGTTFVFFAYDMLQLRAIADRIAILFRGRIVKAVNNTPEQREMLEKANSILYPQRESHIPQHQRGDRVFFANALRIGEQDTLSFDLYKGEIACIVDPNKSVINALRKMVLEGGTQVEGVLYYKGVPLRPLGETRFRDRFVYMEHNAYHHYLRGMTVTENICMGLSQKLSWGGFINRDVIRMLEKEFAALYGEEMLSYPDCRNLTEQEKMALFLFRLRLHRPVVLLCRNLFAETDMITYQMLANCLKDLAADGTAVCMMDSNLERITDFADRYLFPSDNGPLQEASHRVVGTFLNWQ